MPSKSRARIRGAEYWNATLLPVVLLIVLDHLFRIEEHRWHKGPLDGTAVLGPSTATPLSPLLPRHRCCSRNAVSCVTYDSIHRLFGSSISCAEVVLVLMSNMTTDEATFGSRVPLFDHLRGPFLERFEDRRVATRITCKP